MAFNYTDQDIIASLTIGVKDVDPFYNPETNGLTGYAYDGNYYLNGVIQPLVSKATWATEAAGESRGFNLWSCLYLGVEYHYLGTVKLAITIPRVG